MNPESVTSRRPTVGRFILTVLAALALLGLLSLTASAVPSAVPAESAGSAGTARTGGMGGPAGAGGSLSPAAPLRPAAAARPSSVCQPDGTGCTQSGDYRNLNAQINSDWLGFRVVWTGSDVPAHPASQWPVTWTADVTYTNTTAATLTLSCADDWPFYASNVAEIMSGGSGDDGLVSAASTTCTDNPDVAEPIAPGGQATFNATFQNVPWPGSAVTLKLGKVGSSAAVKPFSPPSPLPPCTINPLLACQSLNPRVVLDIDSWGDTSGCTFTWSVDWGDGAVDKNLVVSDPPDGEAPLLSHTYQAQLTYTIAVTGTETGGCTAVPFKATFTLLAYVALGDSYSAGVGAGNPLPGNNSPLSCMRSYNAYPDIVAAALGDNYKATDGPFIFKACNGATTADVGLNQLDALQQGTGYVGLVTLTVGGDDLNFAQVMTDCVIAPLPLQKSCQARDGKAVAQALTALKANLIVLFGFGLAQASGLAPGAKVVIVGYPELFDPKWFLKGAKAPTCGTGVPDVNFLTSDMKWLNSVGQQLDAELSTEAKDFNFKYVNDLTAYSGHYLCENSPDVNDVVKHNPFLSFHPTHDGQKVIAADVEKALSIG